MNTASAGILKSVDGRNVIARKISIHMEEKSVYLVSEHLDLMN